jgi:hypothetical protein
MKQYKYSGVRWFSDVWDDLKPFDIVTKDEYLQIFERNYDYIAQFKNDELITNNWTVGKYCDRLKGTIKPPRIPDRETDGIHSEGVLYLPLPYEFFTDYQTTWTGDICVKNSKTFETQDKCDCHVNCNKNSRSVGHKLKDFKEFIHLGKKWDTGFHSDGAPYTPWAYEAFYTMKNFGLFKPILNGKRFPQTGTHRIFFLSTTNSDVPFFISPKFRTSSGGFAPFFGDGKYCHLSIDSELKKVEFYLSFYHSSFDKDRDEKVGEIVYVNSKW